VLVHDLGRKIVGGAHPAGTALSLEGLCAEYDASRPTVREALRVLESKGMLRIRQSLGTRVQPLEEWNLLDADVVGWRLEGTDRDQQVRELLQMRLAVEPVAAGLAAQAGDPDVVTRLDAALAELRAAAAADDVRAFTEADVSFHATLLESCGNRMFPLLTALVATALEAREEALTQHHADLSAAALEDHGAVLEAIRAEDGPAAERRMREMLSALLSET
jgi:DNA-binding FadR family transcriptional regulator